MGHDYGVPLRFLSVTPTRDNITAPGNRLHDKHTRLLYGKTLDEWTMLQVWSSKYLGHAVFVCETEEHRKRLYPLAIKYDVELIVRPRDMLHPLNDTGGLPLDYGIEHALKSDYYTLVTEPFVVSPCRKPGFFDNMVENFKLLTAPNPDHQFEAPWIMGGFDFDAVPFNLNDQQVGTQLGDVYLSRNPRIRYSTTQHWIAAMWWWSSHAMLAKARHDLSIRPTFYDIEWWEDIHIDTITDWDKAEYFFKAKILDVYGKEGYERYRSSWQDK